MEDASMNWGHCWKHITSLIFWPIRKLTWLILNLHKVRAHQLPHFLINSKVNMVGFVNLHKVAAKMSVFSTLSQVHEMEEKIKFFKSHEKKRKKKREKTKC